MKFTKMHGIGNDYIYFNCFDEDVKNPEELAIKLSDRHFSVGGDGIVLICPSKIADAKMRMFNADGSEGKMCGNAIRCVGKFIYENKITDKTIVDIETLSGVKNLKLNVKGEKVVSVTVNMGKAEFEPSKIPVLLEGDKIVGVPHEFNGVTEKITCVSMGNPHCVIFKDDVEKLELDKIGSFYENAPIFPDRINTEFVKIIDKNTIRMRVWERGSGETMACGTGACAAAAACVANGFIPVNNDITVKLNGGELLIKYTENAVFMTGPAEIAFKGEI